MSRKDIENFVDALSDENYSRAEDSFQAAVNDKVADKIATRAKDIIDNEGTKRDDN